MALSYPVDQYPTNHTLRQTPAGAFQAFLQDQRPALIEVLLRSVPHTEDYCDMSQQLIAASIDAYIDHLDNPPGIQTWVANQVKDTGSLPSRLDMALTLAALYRQCFVDIGLQAIAAGVPGAEDGLQTLMMLGDLAIQAFSQFYQARLQQFEALTSNAPDGVAVMSMEGRIIYANPSFKAMTGYDEATVGMINADFFTTDELEQAVPSAVAQIQTRGQWQGVLTYRRKDGSAFPGQISGFQILDEAGRPQAIGSIIRDISTLQQAEQERLLLQDQIIQAQQAALRELSTPLIPLADGLVAMPLIGSIDSARAQEVIEVLLDGVSSSRANTAILDITGVPVVDTQVANTLLRAAQAVQLLGAKIILTGIRPEVAQTLVGLGVNLSGIVTLSTLQSGISYAMQHTKSAR